jgi:hypothetical protein
MAEELIINIIGFGTEYVPDKKNLGQLKGRDWVEYSPLGAAQYTVIKEWIELLDCTQPLLGKGGDNPAVMMAHMRWNVIKPRYEAWKAGQEMPVDGTPLAAWSGISRSLADALKMHGVRTVEELSKLTDTHKQSMRIMGLGNFIEGAKRFLTAQDSNKVTSALEQKDAEIADLQAKMAELIEMVKEGQKAPPVPPVFDAPSTAFAVPDAKPRRGRPRKYPEQTAA